MYMSDPLRTTDNADDRVHGRPSIFNTGATVLLSVALAVTSSLVAVELKYASPSALTAPPVEKGTSTLTYSKCSDTCPEFSEYYDPNRDYKDPEKQQVGLFECRTFKKYGSMKEEFYCVENI